MSAEELKQRGYCCGMGCKECPYIPKHQFGNTVLAETFKESDEFNKTINQLLTKLTSN